MALNFDKNKGAHLCGDEYASVLVPAELRSKQLTTGSGRLPTLCRYCGATASPRWVLILLIAAKARESSRSSATSTRPPVEITSGAAVQGIENGSSGECHYFSIHLGSTVLLRARLAISVLANPR